MSVGFITIAAWIILTAVGVVMAGWNLRDSLLDYRFAKEQHHLMNGRVLVAKVAIVSEVSRLAAHCLLLVAGILVAAVQFNANPPPASLYVRSAILLTIAILVSHTILARWLRHRLTRRTNP